MIKDKASGFRSRVPGASRGLRRVPSVSCLILVLFLAFPAFAADKLDRYDSAYVNTLNMTDQEIAEMYGVDSTKLNKGPTLQELNEEDPSTSSAITTTASRSLSAAS